MSSPPLNPPNVRYPFTLPDDLHPDVRKAIDFTLSGLTVHEQAFAALKPQIDAISAVANKAASTTVSGVSSFNSETGAVVYFPQLGMVNDQLGNPVYLTQQSDNGAKIIVGDSTAVAVTLNNSVTPPWFTIIDNDSGSVASLTPGVGASLFGEQSIQPGGFGIIYYDGANFWCGATTVATDSTLGYVQPDAVTIAANPSGVIFTQVSVDSGAPGFVPQTPGNPFYFDSSMSPWHGWVWHGGNWNRFS